MKFSQETAPRYISNEEIKTSFDNPAKIVSATKRISQSTRSTVKASVSSIDADDQSTT